MGSAFTQVYANIYMLEWEQDLIIHQKQHNEIYGRLVDCSEHQHIPIQYCFFRIGI